jgi:hypothetical protein
MMTIVKLKRVHTWRVVASSSLLVLIGRYGQADAQPTSAAATARAAREAEVEHGLQARGSKAWSLVATRQSRSGQIIDYVDAKTLYPNAPNAPFATPPPRRAASKAPEVAQALTELETDPSLKPPAGTIPVVRSNFEPYLSGAVPARNLQEYIDTLPKPAPNFSNSRLWGLLRDTRSNIGTGGFINAWNYQQVGSSEMSLLQAGTFCLGSKSSSTMESIEVGLQKSRPLYGDNNVHTFTYFRTAGAATGNRVGGYNLTFQGFVQTAGAPFAPGATVSGPFSAIDGSQYEYQIETELFEGNWWVLANGNWIGYYPTQNSTSVPAAQRITFDLIGSSACSTQWHGEVYDPTPTTWTNADMGSGRFASDGFARAAFIREPWVQLDAATWDWLSAVAPSASPGYDTDCYTVSDIFTNGGTGWTRWFYVGGPGGDNSGCN